jgi:hypothetical protein
MGHQRRISQKKPQYPVIRIITNGEKTEYDYFHLIKKTLDIKNFKIITSIEKAGNPKKLIEEAVRNYPHPYPEDKIFCVADVDDATNQILSEAIKLNRANIQLIISNPNFELWFLLHFHYYNTSFNIADTYVKLKEHFPRYSKNDVKSCFEELKQKENIAIRHAGQLRKHYEDEEITIYSCEANPYTDVDILINYLNSLCA